MLEILLVIQLCRLNRKNAIFRGRKPGGFTALTIVLWIFGTYGMMILGFALGLESGAVLMAVAGAAVGMFIAYFAAKNCKYGPNRLFGFEALPNAEPSPVPTQVNIVRDDGMSTPYRIILNGEEVGKIRGRNYITVSTAFIHNIICVRDFFDVPQPFCFTVVPGTLAEIHVMSGRFIQESCVNCYPIDPAAVNQAVAMQRARQTAQFQF